MNDLSTLSDYDWTRQIAQSLLKTQDRPTKESIEKCVSLAVQNIKLMGRSGQIDEQKLVWELESLYNTWCGIGTVLEDGAEHEPWFDEHRSQISWDFWERYAKYLEQEKKWAPESLKRLDQMTNWVMERIENPKRGGRWSRRGMVVGQVQSGKTSNYTALICKAADAGYKMVIVLAGLHDSLRVQTQLRLDEGFLGTQIHRAFETDNATRIGVGKIPMRKWLIAYSGTSSAQKGDFNRAIAKQYTTVPGGEHPVLLVVKKNKSVLNNVLKWALALRGSVADESGQIKVRNVPLLIIDDEADNASINTNPLPKDGQGRINEEQDPTAINGLIRKLLDTFEQNAYVGYTATPFANIFIDPEARDSSAGADLFPRSFIINLPTPSNYVGPTEVFGLSTDSMSGLETQAGLDVIREVDDYEGWMPDGHKKEWQPPEMPESLRRAIKAFILASAARNFRGHEREHNSMLVHVTRFTAVQRLVAEQVSDELELIQKRLRYGDGKSPNQIGDEFEAIWNADFVPTSQIIGGTESAINFDNLKPLLYRVSSKIKVRTINGVAKDVLDYFEPNNVLNVIAIGGDKLSRGLTLEGLSISYYLRSSRMYDTLMQMGRWFGYRPGYLDLCRLYTSGELVEWYRHITGASEELRAEFDAMAEVGGTPLNYGLKVRTHPAGLVITAVNKMRSGIQMKVSYAGSISETIVFELGRKTVEKNLGAVSSLISALNGKYLQSKRNVSYVWSGVGGEEIVDFLSAYVAADAKKVRPDLLCRYISDRIQHGLLKNWTVALISSSEQDSPHRQIAGLDVGLIRRKPLTQYSDRFTIRRLVSPSDEWIDLSAEQIARLKQSANSDFDDGGREKAPRGPDIRRERGASNGLLLLYPLIPPVDNCDLIPGFAVSFPADDSAPAFDYVVNNPFWEQEFGEG